MKTYYQLLGNSMVVATKNMFVWFAMTYWVYLGTKSVVATGVAGGIYMIASAASSVWMGSLVDHYKKKAVLIGSNIITLVLFAFGLAIYLGNPASAFSTIANPWLWVFMVVLLTGALAGNVVNIVLPTLVPVLVPKDSQDKANGMFGTAMGISFAITSVASGFVLGLGGMPVVLTIAIVLTIAAILHLLTISIPEKAPVTTSDGSQKIDFLGTLRVVKNIPGLLALIFFTTFNNFVGGVFMALMDAYGLTLVSVQVWGMLWGALSLGFIAGGMYIAKKGLGPRPLHGLFNINIVIWTVCIFFTIQPSIVLLAIGALFWMTLVPFIEATEQTILQKVVPAERLGRVFGFAHSIEQAASPITAFLIGPIAQYIFIPFMTTGAGVGLIGNRGGR